tara:strand:+ start:360 stop:722 length:363 start_codon:yes stop_codon:yes gene_type:complete
MEKILKIYSYSLCGTCRKALKWLKQNNVNYQHIDIMECPPSKEYLMKAIDQYGRRKSLFNTSGISYRNLGASNVESMSNKQAIKALIKDSKLIKRPFVITPKNKILIGFKPKEWEEELLD